MESWKFIFGLRRFARRRLVEIYYSNGITLTLSSGKQVGKRARQSRSVPPRKNCRPRDMATTYNLHRAVELSSGDSFLWKRKDRESWKTEPQAHGIGQLLSLDSGSAAMEVGNASWLLLPGSIGWIPPQHVHSLRSQGATSGWSLHVQAAQSIYFPKNPLIARRSSLVEQIVIRIAGWRQSDVAPETLGRMLAVLADEMMASPSDGAYLPLPRDPRLMKVINKLSQHPTTQYHLDHWAKEIGMSKRSLTRTFERQTGFSVGQWVQNFRVSLAAEKLAAGYDITAAALSCGYMSISAFIKVFHSIMGITPAKYRRITMDEGRVITNQVLLKSDFAVGTSAASLLPLNGASA
jgi:AraC-like DNA-binding protein